MMTPAVGGAQPLRQLYNKLADAYGATSHDNETDIQTALSSLRIAMGKGLTEEVLLYKARAAGLQAGDFKSKISSVIVSKFWEREYSIHVVGRVYEPPQPHPYDPEANKQVATNPYPPEWLDADQRRHVFANRPAEQPASPAAEELARDVARPQPRTPRPPKGTKS